MNGRPGIPVAARLPLLAAGGFVLLGGLYAALLLLDAPLPDTASGAGQVHRGGKVNPPGPGDCPTCGEAAVLIGPR